VNHYSQVKVRSSNGHAAPPDLGAVWLCLWLVAPCFVLAFVLLEASVSQLGYGTSSGLPPTWVLLASVPALLAFAVPTISPDTSAIRPTKAGKFRLWNSGLYHRTDPDPGTVRSPQPSRPNDSTSLMTPVTSACTNSPGPLRAFVDQVHTTVPETVGSPQSTVEGRRSNQHRER